MTEEEFTESINLYLDKEISEEMLQALKSELAGNPDRQAEFAKICRLHQAMRLALRPQSATLPSAKSSLGWFNKGLAPCLALCAGLVPLFLIGYLLVWPPTFQNGYDWILGDTTPAQSDLPESIGRAEQGYFADIRKRRMEPSSVAQFENFGRSLFDSETFSRHHDLQFGTMDPIAVELQKRPLHATTGLPEKKKYFPAISETEIRFQDSSEMNHPSVKSFDFFKANFR